MNIETKSLYSNSSEYINNCFGWQKSGTESVRSGRSHHTNTIYARDKDMPHYLAILSCERRYYYAANAKKEYEGVNGWVAFGLFFALIFPMIIYLILKGQYANRCEEHNDLCQKEMDAAVEMARKFLKE